MMFRSQQENLQYGLLLTPFFLIALAILILNDHYLKAAYPSWLTGKLSDFAGLLVFAVFFAVILRISRTTPFRNLALHLSVGIMFMLWKLAPVEIVLDQLAALTGLPMPTRIKDPTDLIALAMLPISFLICRRFGTSRYHRTSYLVLHRTTAILLLCVSGWSIMATSIPLPTAPPGLYCCEGIRGNVNGDPDEEVSIADAVYLVSFLQGKIERPECIEEADVDGSGDKYPVTMEDVDYLLKAIMGTGPPPADCPN